MIVNLLKNVKKFSRTHKYIDIHFTHYTILIMYNNKKTKLTTNSLHWGAHVMSTVQWGPRRRPGWTEMSLLQGSSSSCAAVREISCRSPVPAPSRCWSAPLSSLTPPVGKELAKSCCRCGYWRNEATCLFIAQYAGYHAHSHTHHSTVYADFQLLYTLSSTLDISPLSWHLTCVQTDNLRRPGKPRIVKEL